MVRLLGGDPAINQPVSHGERQREIAVAVRGAETVFR
jgi:hypothetical protein